MILKFAEYIKRDSTSKVAFILYRDGFAEFIGKPSDREVDFVTGGILVFDMIPFSKL